jgi:hypothetical protein
LARAIGARGVYQGFGEVWRGLTKNIAYILNGWLGALLVLLTLGFILCALVPPAVLIAALAGAPIAGRDVFLAAAGFGSSLAARVLLATALGDAVWPSLTHPLMAAVWAGLAARSLFDRFVRRRLSWRGRDFAARDVRF